MILLGWACTALVLASYLATALTGRPGWFDWGNVLLCVPLALSEAYVGATFAAVLSMTFGNIAIVGLFQARRKRRIEAP